MSLRSIVQGINELGDAYFAVRSDKRQAEAAMTKATKIHQRVVRGGKTMISQDQLINVDGQKMVAIDDGATRRIVSYSDQTQRE